MTTNYYHEQDGFTLIELMVSTVIISILALIISQFYTLRLADYARTFTLTVLQSNTKQAIESLAKDIRVSRTIEGSNSLPDLHGPGGNAYGWTSTTGSGATLVLGIPTQDSSGNLIYVDPLTHSTPYLNDIIYFVDSSTKILYRRTIANSAAVGNSAVSTCPPSAVTASCPLDGEVIENVANLSTAYYDGLGNTAASPSSSYSLDITLQQTQARFGRTYSNTLTSRVSLRNKP